MTQGFYETFPTVFDSLSMARLRSRDLGFAGPGGGLAFCPVELDGLVHRTV
jgi:hypothetical protein